MSSLFIRPIVAVYVNGVQKRSLSGGVTHGLRSGFAAAVVEFAVGDSAVPGDLVRIDLGYDLYGVRTVFTGEVADDSLQYWPNKHAIVCEGYLARMQRGLGVESVTADPDPTTGEAPAYQAEGITDKDIIEALLTLYGIPEGDIQGDDPEQTFGNIEPVKLGKDEPGWNLSGELDRVTFCRLIDGMDGFARRVVVNGLPGSASVTLTEGVDLLEGSRVRTRRGIINAVTMTGLPDAGGPGVTPKAERKEDSDYVPTPPRYQSEGATSVLLETEAQCDLWAARRLAQTNRLVESVTVRPARARPDIYPGMTLAINASHLGYSSGYVFWVEQVQHNWDARGIKTTLQLLASSGEAGVNPNMAPVAIIHLRMERETLDDGSTIYVVFADGRDSYDPDGIAVDLDPQHGITTYLWSGSTAPVTPIGLPTATFVYSVIPTGQTITLTVADVSLKLGTATVPITALMVAKVNVRTLWAAVTTDLLFSYNGGKTWLNVGYAAVGCCAIAHPTYQFAWSSAGVIAKITVDTAGSFASEVITTPTGVTAMSINIGVDGTGTGRCWAGTSSGAVWFSASDGDEGTWVLVGTITVPIGASAAITSIEESPLGNGDLYGTAGNGQYHSFDAGATWVVTRAYADVALVASRQASGAYTDLTTVKNYHWVAYRGTSVNTMSRFLESGNQEDLDAETAQKPFHATGLTIGIIGPELYVSGYKDATGYILGIDDFTGGGNLQVLTYNPAFGLPAHLIRDGDFDAIIYGAAADALFKTYDRFATILNLRSLTGTQVGKMIGYGPLHPLPPVFGALLWIGNNNTFSGTARVFALDADGFSFRAVSPCDGDNGTQILLSPAPGVLLCYSRVNNGYDISKFGPGATGNLFRSIDGGFTWDAVADPATVSYVYTHGDGVAYAISWASSASQAGAAIYRSLDAGATWELRSTWSATAGPSNSGEAPSQVLYSPADPLVVIVRHNGLYRSLDGGATFNPTIWAADTATSEFGANGLGRFSLDGAGIARMREGSIDVVAYPAATVTDATNLEWGVVPYYVDGATVAQMYVYGVFGVRVSEDGGITWVDWYDDARAPVNVTFDVRGFVARDLTNPGYVLAHIAGDHESFLASQAIDADSADEWVDLTPAFNAQLPAYVGAAWCYREGAIRLPSE